MARYEQVHAVLNDPQTFCSSRGVGLSDFAKEKPWRPASLILEADPPAHTRTRAVLNQVLSATAMKPLRGHFTALAEAKVDELLARGSFDAIADLAEAYPLSVFPDAMGLKQEGRENLLPYASLVFNAFGPPNQSAPGGDRALGAASVLCGRAVPARESRARRVRRLHPRPRRCRRHHRTRRRRCWCARCSRPGSTRPSTASAPPSIASRAFPTSWRSCAADPSLARNAFEEAVRFESPVQTFFRTTTREVEIGGHAIGEGEKVLMFLGAANRDPRRWENADSYDITRRTSGHVGYGSGIHMCVGQLVARLEGEVMMAALARKVGIDRDHRRGEAPLQQHAARARKPAGHNLSRPERRRNFEGRKQ